MYINVLYPVCVCALGKECSSGIVVVGENQSTGTGMETLRVKCL